MIFTGNISQYFCTVKIIFLQSVPVNWRSSFQPWIKNFCEKYNAGNHEITPFTVKKKKEFIESGHIRYKGCRYHQLKHFSFKCLINTSYKVNWNIRIYRADD